MKNRRVWEILVLFTLFAAVLIQCDQFILSEVLETESPERETAGSTESQAAALSIAPVAATLAANSSLTFSASGGTPPYSYSIASGSGTIAADTGKYSAPPGTGTDSVRVTDSAGETNDAAVTVTTTGALGISPSNVSLATDGTITFTANGGAEPYAFSLVTGEGSIDAVSGAYTAPSTSGSATVRVTDSQGTPETADATISISAVGTVGALSISPSSMVLGTGGSVDFGAFGGVAPYAFSLVSGGGSVDPGTGVYDAPSTAGTATIRVTDSDSPVSTDDATVTVNAPAPGTLSISPASISLFTNSTAGFGATGGVPPYSFSVIAGSGSVAAVTGVFTAPSTAGASTIRATDSDSPASTADATVTINAPAPDPLSISPSSMVLGTGGSVNFNVHGGVAPFTFSVVSGGGSVDPGTGVYDAPAVADNVTVRVTDSDSPASTDDATVTVNAPAPDPLSITPASISLFTNSTAGFGATGGVPPYTFAVVSGSGSVNAGTGVFTAPSTAGSSTIRVTDSDSPSAQTDATATVYEPLRIVPESKSISVGSSFGFSATGGKTPYNFTVVSGGGSINAATGVYNAPGGSGNVVVRVTDDLLNTGDAAVTVTAAQPLVISPASTTILAGDSMTFTVNGGTSPYTFSILPPADGSINSATGEYTAPGSTATDTVRVTDALSNTSDATATVVSGGPLSISPDSVTVPVNGQKVFSAAGGAPPYSFAIVSGDGSINASTGTYSAPATADTVTVRVTDSLLNDATAAVTVAGAVCGLSFTESEPNDSTDTPWSHVDDFGIELVPGCTVTINGMTDPDDDSDVFTFDRGSANVVTFIVTWNSGGNELDLELYNGGGNSVADSDSDDADREFMMWTVGGGSPTRYLEILPKASGGVNYTLTISAD